MARGWESKSVEAQIESQAEPMSSDGAKRVTPEEAKAARKKKNLLLSRAQVERSLAATDNPRYRHMLEQALADLDHQISKL
jgi:putative hemolysin